MPCFRKVLPLLLSAAFCLPPRPSLAAPISTYDLESLCYRSTDVVEATIVRHHAAGHIEWDDRFTATVTSSLAGQYKPGDKINALDLFLYNPNATGQRCILFITRKEFHLDSSPEKTIAPQAVDMLLVDGHYRVWRYYQWSNPGGVTAAVGPPGVNRTAAAAALLEANLPTLDAEARIITAKWAAVDRLRPLLARTPTRADVPALQALVRARRYPSGPGLQNVIGEAAQERLAELHVKAD